MKNIKNWKAFSEGIEQKEITSKTILQELEDALSKFGAYSFDDKGPHEVMNITPITDYIKTLSKEEAAAILKEVVDAEGYSDRNKELASAIVGDCDEMPEEWFDYVIDNSGAEY